MLCVRVSDMTEGNLITIQLELHRKPFVELAERDFHLHCIDKIGTLFTAKKNTSKNLKHDVITWFWSTVGSLQRVV